jgi:creatinine amidohydrolase
MQRPYILTDTTWHDVRDTRYDVAVLPWGATEAHNYHLPYGTDTIETTAVAAEAARLAWEAGARALVLPTIPFGVQSGQLDIPFCLHMNPSTQLVVLRELCDAVMRAGVQKLVILNGHGGNDFRALIRELVPHTSVFLCVVNWYACIDAAQFFAEPGDHGGELETSVMLHIAGDLVSPLSAAGSGDERRFRIEGLRDGWAWAPRQWTRISADTGVGNPAAATAAKGEAYFAAVTQRIAGFLRDLAATSLDDLYDV